MKTKNSKHPYKKEEYKNIENTDFESVERALKLIDGKWKLRILYVITCKGVLRYGELKKLLSPITHKMLSTQLKELEKDMLVNRKEYPGIPPKVEYSITKKGADLVPAFEEICKWIKKYKI